MVQALAVRRRAGLGRGTISIPALAFMGPTRAGRLREPGENVVDPWSAAVVEQNRRWLSAYLLSVTGDPGAVDDLVQECFTIAYGKRESFAPGTNFGGWLRSIARNVALRHCQKRKRGPLVDHGEALEQLDRAAAGAESRSVEPGRAERRNALLRDCLRYLSGKARKVLAMRYNQGMSTVEIAETVGAGTSAINTAIYRARMQLGKCIRRKEGR